MTHLRYDHHKKMPSIEMHSAYISSLAELAVWLLEKSTSWSLPLPTRNLRVSGKSNDALPGKD